MAEREGAVAGHGARWGIRRHPVAWSIGAVVLVVGVWLGVRALTPTTVRGVTMQERDLVSTLVLAGRVRPPARVAAGATIVGTVRRVPVREGDRVERGQLLVALEDREARAAVAQAEAALAEVTAQTRATIVQAENEARQAARDLERVEAVFRDGALTEQRLEQARQRAEDARSRLAAARASTGPGSNAAVARARAALDAARARLALTRIEAPADGVVLSRAVEPGDAVQPGRPLLELSLDGPTELVVFPSEDNLGRLQLGAPATASADAYPDSTFGARVSLIAPAVDPTQGTIEVRLAVDDPPAYLRPEMTVSVNIEAGRSAGARVLPASAVRGLGTDSPWVGVVRDGRLARQPVTVGLRADPYVQILSGLEPGEAVVPPDGSPQPGDRVRVRAPGE